RTRDLRRSRRHVTESDRTGVEVLVLRKKSLGKAVPSVADFIDFGRRKNMHVRNRNELDARRRLCVESRQLTAARGQRERKRLSAVAEKIPSRQCVIRIEGVVHLADKTRQVVERGRGDR